MTGRAIPRFRRALPAAAGLVVVAAFALAAQRPAVAAGPLSAGADIRFSATVLNPITPTRPRTQRPVEPALAGIAPWISAVGAAVGVGDLAGNGYDGDACLVDPRDDSVTVFAVAGSGSRLPTQRLVPPDPRPTEAPMGCVPVDINEDGHVDVLVYYWGRSPVIFENTGGGRVFRAHELVQPREVWNTTAVNVVDLDGDGHLDIIVGNYFPDGARVLDPSARTDGRIQMQDSMSLARNGGVNRIFLGHPTPKSWVAFTDASTAFPNDSARSWTLAFGAQDLTGDGLPELYVANDFGPDQLLVNHSRPGVVDLRPVVGDRTLTAAKSSVLGRDSFKGMGVTFTHVHGAADASIFVSNITTPYALQESNFFYTPVADTAELKDGRSPYRQDAEIRGVARGGWSWDAKAADFDNDGTEEIAQATGFVAGNVTRWPELQELALANDSLVHDPRFWLRLQPGDDIAGHEPNRLWCIQPDGRYQDCAARAGFGSTDVTRGFAVADINHDGLADVLVAKQWTSSTLLTNRTATPNGAVWVRMVQPTPNGGTRAATGAALQLQTPSGAQYRQLFPANGHAGVSGADVNFGLGPVTQPVAYTGHVTWRTSTGQLRTRTVALTPGRHVLTLNDDGTADVR